MSEKKVCTMCAKEFDEVVSHAGLNWCNDCYREQIEKKTNKNSNTNYGDGAINTLSFLAKLSLIAGIVGAIIVWYTFGSVKVGYHNETNPMGVISGFVLLFQGIFGWTFFEVVCSMACNLIAIRKNTSPE